MSGPNPKHPELAVTGHRWVSGQGAMRESPHTAKPVSPRPPCRLRALRLLLPLTLLLAGCAGPPALPAPAPTRMANPGFDSWRYPGDDLMSAWRTASPYRWVGYYLPAPCHRDTSWSGKRETLTRLGWGIAILYVGQQVFEGQPQSEITESTVCSRALLTPERGRVDALDAITRAEREGFPRGSIIFLDVERMEQIPPSMISYYQAWLRTVLSDGRYRPGTYAHRSNAAALYMVAQGVFTEAGRAESAPFWLAGGQGFSLDARPEAVGYPFAHIWQGALDVDRTWAGRTLKVDENVARRASPSAPDSL